MKSYILELTNKDFEELERVVIGGVENDSWGPFENLR